MTLKKINSVLSVSPQIDPADMQAIADAGFKTVISNRPDGEQAEQASFQEIKNAAEANGLTVVHVPVISGAMTEADVSKFEETVSSAAKPVLAFCRTGTRSTILWAYMSARGGATVEDILEKTNAAGFELSEHRSNLEQARS